MKHPFEIKEVKPERWKDFEMLFGSNGACGGCWCMNWRLLKQPFEKGKGSGNKKAIKKIIQSGAVPGLIAYDALLPIGWCSVAPRDLFPRLENARTLRRIDDAEVWSISCLFIDKRYRRAGLSVELIKAAVKFVKKRGGKIVEGYPYEVKGNKFQPPPFVWTGMVPAYKKASFKIAARFSQSRPIMRCYLTK